MLSKRRWISRRVCYSPEAMTDDSFVTVKAARVPQPCSAQKVDLKAMTEAWKLASGKRADIYTDSTKALWKQRGFKKTDGSPIQHMDEITELMTAIMRFTSLAMIKAHNKGNDFVIKGNAMADKSAMAALHQ